MSQIATYEPFIGPGSGTVKTLTGDTGPAVPPDGAGNIDIAGEHGIATHGLGNTVFVGIQNAISLGDLSPILGLPALFVDTGDITINGGNLEMPNTITSGLGGVITFGGDRFISNFGTGDNVFVGRLSGNTTNTAFGNVGLGAGTLLSLTTGNSNVAIGEAAGSDITTSVSNIAIGINALDDLTTGIGQNIAIGTTALTALQTGRDNIGIGTDVGNTYTTSESSNILINSPGVIGDNNTIRIGVQGAAAGQQNKFFAAGINGVTVGSPATVVIDTVTGQLGVNPGGGLPIDTITGDTGGALPPDAAGNFNILGAHGINTSGAVNTLTVAINNAITLGDLALLTAGNNALTITSGDITLSGTGVNAAGNINLPNTNTSGGQGEIKFGGDRWISNFGITGNTFVGANSGNTTNTALANAVLGTNCLASITTGSENVAIGYEALRDTTTSDHNIALGVSALRSLTTAVGENIAIGATAASTLLTGRGNVIIGHISGTQYTGSESSNILINSTGVNGESNALHIGAATGSGNQQLNKCFIAGIDGVNVGSVAKVVTMASDQLGTATLTAGTNITITPGANTITIDASGGSSFTWSVITANQTAAVNNGYICNKAGTLVLTLPAASAVGDIIEVTGINTATGWQLAVGTGQKIYLGTSSTTITTGTLTSSAIRDSIKIVCVVANTDWNAVSVIGNITVV